MYNFLYPYSHVLWWVPSGLRLSLCFSVWELRCALGVLPFPTCCLQGVCMGGGGMVPSRIGATHRGAAVTPFLGTAALAFVYHLAFGGGGAFRAPCRWWTLQGGNAPPRTPRQRDAGGRTPRRMGGLFKSPLGLVVSAARGCWLWVVASLYTLIWALHRYVVYSMWCFIHPVVTLSLSPSYSGRIHAALPVFVFSIFPALSHNVSSIAYIYPHISFPNNWLRFAVIYYFFMNT